MRRRLMFPALVALVVAGAAWAKKPVVQEGSAPPPPPAEVAPQAPEAPKKDDKKKEGKKEGEGAETTTPAPAPAAPTPPPPPPRPEFYGMPKPAEAGPQKPAEEDPDPAELRFSKRAGDYAVEMALHPGKPRPGEPLEVVFDINEILRIPDPNLGDRRPLTKVKLVAEVRGPDPVALHELHRLTAKGEYGLHFTPGKQGLYAVVLDRADGKKGFHAEFALGVGVPTPIPEDRSGDPSVKDGMARGRRPVFKPTFDLDERARKPGQLNEAAPITGLMKELGKRWLVLGRAAGTPGAAAALEAVATQARLAKGNVPPRHAKDGTAFDRYAGELVTAVEGLAGSTSDAGRLQAAMMEVQDTQCLKCHAQYRFDFASDVWRWPDFTAAAKGR